jgi:hypothetical protein
MPLPSPKPGQRILCHCECCGGLTWSKVLELTHRGGEPALLLKPEPQDCLCNWLLMEDWDPAVVREVRVGEAWLWRHPSREKKGQRAESQMGLFGSAT